MLNEYKKIIENIAIGNLALEKEIKRPKVLKLVVGKSKKKVFGGCWQVANGEDAC